MGNIKHNDELLRINDDGFDVVFNCDNKHQNGVSYHAEKNGKKTKIDPEYAAASLVKKVGQGGWPSDLPKPSEGGYGYATEVTDEAEFICKRPEAGYCWHRAEIPEGLIVGESYEVTVNGVTGTYECFEHEGMPTLGYPYEFESHEPNKWIIYNNPFDELKTIEVGINLRPGETATIVILSIENILEGNQSVEDSWADEIEIPEGLIVGESYEVTVNGVTGTYECFEDNGSPTLGYTWEIMEQYEHGVWQIYSYEADGINLIGAGMNLRPGETATFVVKLVVHEDHRIEPKYLPEGGFGWTEEIGEITTIIDGTFYYADSSNPVELTDEYSLVEGQSYNVTFNGTEYNNLIAFDNAGYISIGAPYGEYDDYPFHIENFEYSSDRSIVFYAEMPGNYSLVVTAAKGVVIHKIDKKYLPGGDFIIDNAILVKENDDESTMDEYPFVSFAGEENRNMFLIVCSQFEDEDTGELRTEYDRVIPRDWNSGYSLTGLERTTQDGRRYLGTIKLFYNGETGDGHYLFKRSVYWCECQEFQD